MWQNVSISTSLILMHVHDLLGIHLEFDCACIFVAMNTRKNFYDASLLIM